MIDFDLYYRVWQQEHDERMRTAALLHSARDSRPVAVGNGTRRSLLSVLDELSLRLRTLWTVRRPA